MKYKNECCFTSRAFAAFSVLALAACSTLQVDVDVYKGPLSNDKDVELEQFAILASAAKPVLEKYQVLEIEKVICRESGRNNQLSARPSFGLCVPDKRLRKELNACATFKDLSCARRYRERAEKLRKDSRSSIHHIEEVLKLYRNIENYFAKVNDDLQELNTHYSISKASRHNIDALETLHEIAGLYLDVLDYLNRNPYTFDTRREQSSYYSTYLSALVERMDMRNLAVTLQLYGCFDHALDEKLAQFREQVELATDSRFRKLWSCDSVPGDVAGFWRNKNSSSRAFWSGGNVYRVAREGLVAAVTDNPMAGVEALHLAREKNIARDYKKILEKFVLESGSAPTSGNDLDKRLKAFYALRAFYDSSRDKTSNAGDREAWTVNLDSLACDAAQTDGNACEEKARTWTTRNWLYQGAQEDPIVNVQTFDAAVSSFGDTRLTPGIETLIFQFIDYRDCLHADWSDIDCPGSPGDQEKVAERARERLAHALIRFAQQLVFLADSQAYFEHGRSNGERDQSVTVLQAIGNAILVLADDYKRLDNYDRDQRNAAREIAAVRASVSGRPGDSFEAILHDIDVERTSVGGVSAALAADMGGLNAELKKLSKQLTKANGYASDFNNTDADLRDDSTRDGIKQYINNDLNRAIMLAYEFVGGRFESRIEENIVTATGETTPSDFKDRVIEELEKVAIEIPAITDEIDLIKDYLNGSGAFFSQNAGAKIGWDSTTDKSYSSAWIDHKSYLAKRGEPLSELRVLGSEGADLDRRIETAEEARGEFAAAAATLVEIGKKHPDHSIVLRKKNPSATYDWIISEIDNLTAVELSDGAKVKARKVITYDRVSSVMSRIDLALLDVENPDALLGERVKRTDVLRQVVDQLKYAHIDAIRRQGENGSDAVKIAAAIKMADDYRSGLAYIRPIGSYLRSSFAASDLTANKNLFGWNNTLSKQAARGFVPFWNEAGEKEEVLSRIDSQFWQTINTVRVAGGGNTNYVVAKDDVGNFYVKGYESNHEDIFKSMSNLALFGIGGAMGTNLLRRDEQGKLVLDNTSPATEIYEKYENRYAEQTKKHLESVRAVLGSGEASDAIAVVKSVRGVWASDAANKSGLNIVADTAGESLQMTASTLKTRDEVVEQDNSLSQYEKMRQRGEIIMDGLFAIQLFQQKIDSSISAQTLDANDPAANKLKQYQYRIAVAKTVNKEIEQILDARRRALADYENGVIILGEVVAAEQKSDPATGAPAQGALPLESVDELNPPAAPPAN